MYQLYTVWCHDKNTTAAYGRTYRDLFNSKINLGFGSPKSDTCSLCDSGTDAVSDHKLRADSGYRSMKKDRQSAVEDQRVAYITFDTQETFATSKTLH